MKNVQDVLPLTPMQELMLLHLASASDSGVLFEQEVLVLDGPLDAESLRRAWQHVLDRHQALRAAFLFQGLGKPVQVIRQQVRLPWEQLDWSELSAEDLDRRLRAHLTADRDRGFDPAVAPLLRVALIRAGGERHDLVLSFHHILMDRWSLGIVLREVFMVYNALRHARPSQLASPRPYRDYLTYMQRRNTGEQEAYWRRVLAGVSRPTLVPGRGDPSIGDASAHAFETMRLHRDTTERLRELSREHRLTLSTVAQSAFGLTLARVTDTDDVVIGVTVAARPPAIDGIDSMVGLFTNNLPVRIRVERRQPVVSWLAGLQRQSAELRDYETDPLPLVRDCCAIPPSQPLFEALVVFQNDPAADALDAAAQVGLHVEAAGGGSGFSRTGYPLTLMVHPGETLAFSLIYDRRRVDAHFARHLLDQLARLLDRITSEPADVSVGALLDAIPGHERAAADAALPTDAQATEPDGFAFAVDDGDDDYVAPSTTAERVIAEVWRDLLGVERISVHDNFFELGGSSVLAAQSITRLRRKAGIQMNAVLMAMQTLGQLAAACESSVRA